MNRMKIWLGIMAMMFTGQALASNYWASLKSMNTEDFRGSALSFNYLKNSRVYTLDFRNHLNSHNLDIYSDVDYPETIDSIRTISLLYGVARVRRLYNLTAQVGIGVLAVNANRNCKRDVFYTVDCDEEISYALGLPIEISARRGRLIGFGINGFANLNPVKTIMGVGLSIEYGRFHKRQ